MIAIALSTLLSFIPLALTTSTPPPSSPLPLIIWHGLGDNYANPGLISVAELANATNPNTPIHIVSLADSPSSDRSASFFGNVTLQIQSVCDTLSTDPIISRYPAINALGFSQGGQFLRAYVERCNNPPVANLITYGSQHNGIMEFQKCDSGDWVCRGARSLLRGNTWSNFVQSRLVPAQYFRDPKELESYLEHSNFLADINNEREEKNAKYAENLKKLKNFVMVVFKDDRTVVPKESGWFGERNSTSNDDDNEDYEWTQLRNRTIYKEDWLGLRWLDERGRLAFDEVEGGHMDISDKDLKYYFKKYFGAVSWQETNKLTVQEELK
ncbi:MAG: hypothetical protein M1834_007350 [Cirrosporium novae-zelandiae]|nr:MAG: hypothetical protein M1834_007350 [Cirrosporium novae-zelandiae]